MKAELYRPNDIFSTVSTFIRGGIILNKILDLSLLLDDDLKWNISIFASCPVNPSPSALLFILLEKLSDQVISGYEARKLVF